ncbi:l-ascorbate oxidase [Moniliophthora roreri]|uniref:Peroxidase n=1 Tax=Moniliophthora roreri TaxID=221103 RepID=A0A0W0F2A7_MONRR|nr:l-ascorbate oxidase [Moniliophthora roreri]
MRRAFSSLSLAVALTTVAASVNLHWPYTAQIRRQEDLLYESQDLSIGCLDRQDTTIAAQWARTAFHDMATHNVGDGSGGLDASIRFELDRSENVGVGLLQTLSDFSRLQSRVSGLADILAMATVFAYGGCGGPLIPYRAGRVDAASAGVPGVPEPHQDLQSHIDSFARQGFTQSEMIGLVACGHAFGGVRKDDFPTMGLVNDFELFHGSQEFSNTVVTGFLDGTTPNPLVKAPNVTMRSDDRIFSSDSGATMQRYCQFTFKIHHCIHLPLDSIASAQAFDDACASLIERMINTVPSSVTLTDVIQPIENKVGKARLFVSSDSNDLILRTSLRLLNPSDNPSRTVTLFWTDRRAPSTCPATGCTSASVSAKRITGSDVNTIGASGFDLHGITAWKYQFEASINAASSIDKFWFEIDEHDGSSKVVVNNGGSGYVVEQDQFLFDPVKDASGAPQVSVRSFDPTSVPVTSLPVVADVSAALDSTISPRSGYTFFSANIGIGTRSFDVIGQVGGSSFIEEVVLVEEEIQVINH